MSVHRAGGSGLRDEALQPSIRGASCTGRARARRLDGLLSFRTSPAGTIPGTTIPGTQYLIRAGHVAARHARPTVERLPVKEKQPPPALFRLRQSIIRAGAQRSQPDEQARCERNHPTEVGRGRTVPRRTQQVRAWRVKSETRNPRPEGRPKSEIRTSQIAALERRHFRR